MGRYQVIEVSGVFEVIGAERWLASQ